MWFFGAEVEQETLAPPPKRNPGSAPVLGLKSQKSCRNGSVSSMRAYPSRAFVIIIFFFFSFLKPEEAPLY